MKSDFVYFKSSVKPLGRIQFQTLQRGLKKRGLIWEMGLFIKSNEKDV